MVEKEKNNKDNWLVINLDSIWNNLSSLQGMLLNQANIMAVVKDNAYGFGSVKIARYLEQKGISFFGVANLNEGIELRKSGIESKILILGYTNPDDIYLVQKYRLIQTVLDEDYAKSISSVSKIVEVHVKIDTGMHRNGEIYSHIDRIKSIFRLPNLKITGLYSHLSVPDSKSKIDIEFTNKQILRFAYVIRELLEAGITVQCKHLLSSYGIINYPQYAFDFIRVGISMYGVPAFNEKIQNSLKIAYTLQSKVVLIKTVCEGDSVGYGRTFIADKTRKIAVVSLGYAVALPRALSNKGRVIINEKYSQIIGNICMDHCLIDITDIEGVRVGSIVTFLGKAGNKVILIEEWARLADTIPNELLSKIDRKIARIYLE